MFSIYDFKIEYINLIDFLLVVVFTYQLFKILKGSLAFNILIGLLTVYTFWLIVRYLKMPILSEMFGRFVEVGIIGVLVVFQQEIRRFLLLIGSNSLGESNSKKRWFNWSFKEQNNNGLNFTEIVETCKQLAQHGDGATLVFPKSSQLKFIASSGEIINAEINRKLLMSIFSKSSPLHDGAVIIANGKIIAANCVLPVSENPEMIKIYGLRHLSAIGITEQTDAVCLVVSEEKQHIRFVKDGIIEDELSLNQMILKLNQEFLSDGSSQSSNKSELTSNKPI